MIVNGREYPLWSQFVELKREWIGGVLTDYGDKMDVALGAKPMTTVITDIELVPNGEDSAYFMVKGEGFDCGFDVRYGGIGGDSGEVGITFSGYGGHRWRIESPKTRETQ